MVRILVLLLLLSPAVFAGTAADVARAIRENRFDRDECYRVRDLTLVREDIRIYLTDGHLIFSKPVSGRRIAAVFTADVDGGDAEILLLPPDRAERTSLARYIDSPNLDEHFRAALLLFTGDEYETLRAQLPANPANKKTPEAGALLDEEWTPALQNLGASYQTRLTFDLVGGPGHPGGLFAAMINGAKLGSFDVVLDPDSYEQVFAGRVTNRDNRLYFDTWTSFAVKSRRGRPEPPDTLSLNSYRIEATVSPDLSLSVVTRVKVKPSVDGMTTATFDINPEMEIGAVAVDGRPAEWLQRDALRFNLTRGGNGMFLVIPPEPLRAGREYDFEFRYSGKVIHDAGDRVLYVSARGNWYPTHGFHFCDYDLTFRTPLDLELVSAGDVVEDRTEGDWRITRRRTAAPIRVAAFNLGAYEHARVERGGYVVDVCANRALEKALQPRPQTVMPSVPQLGNRRGRPDLNPDVTPPPPVLDPLERLQTLASEVASALEFMTSRFGPPPLPHLTVSPIPGAFGQGFPGLLYLSTLSYLKHVPRTIFSATESQELFFADLLQAHETAHQWWGNRVSATGYRDYWLMEALANYSALLYLEKSKGGKAVDLMLDSYRANLLQKNEAGQLVDSTGPIVLGPRLETSQEPRAWRTITYGKGSWILHMLRGRMGDERFLAMLAELLRRYDHKMISTGEFQALASGFMPARSDDPQLVAFFDQWVYGTGVPSFKMNYSVKGKAPALKVVGTIEQAEVDEDFSTLVPVEIQTAHGRPITHWVRTGSTPVTFTVAVTQAPSKVTLDPRRTVLRR